MEKHEKISVKVEEKKWYVDKREKEEPKVNIRDVVIGATYIVASVGLLATFFYIANKIFAKKGWELRN